VPLLEIRHLLARTGHANIGRMDDHQVRKAARSLPVSAASLRNLADIRRVLAWFSESGGDRIGLLRLFDRAIDLLDFKTPPNKGLIYADQYFTMGDPSMAPDDRLTEEIRNAAARPSGAADKTTLAHTSGGKWLLPWNLRFLLGAAGEDQVWARATRRFVEALSGDAEVLLPTREFEFAMRTPPWHPLYEVAGITGVIYFLDDDARRILNPPRELFEAGVVRKVFGKNLVFRARQ